MNFRRFTLLSVILVIVGFFAFKDHFVKDTKNITLVVPVEHQALTEMAEGFGAVIRASLKDQNYDLLIVNAMGDRHVMHSLIEQAERRHDAVVATIGTELTLMAAHTLKTIPVVGLDVTTAVTQSEDNITGVYEGKIEPGFAFLRNVLKDLKKVAVLYSPTDKIEQQIASLEKSAAEQGIQLQKIVVQSLADLYTLSNHIDADAGALFILKDHLLASGAATLKTIAEKRHIPFIASDEGSVVKGAAFAVGNSESDIGRIAAELVVDVVNGKKPKDIKMQPASDFQVFYNAVAAQEQGVDLAHLKSVAEQQGYRTNQKG
ncbi:MAG: ABC transporter substrate-binding protein [Candidatus Nucleicultricaceae bacterium]